MRSLFRAAAIAAIVLWGWSCVADTDPISEAERLYADRNYPMAMQYANRAFTRLDTMSQLNRCRLAVIYFRISEAADFDTDSILSDSAFNRFRLAYRASLSPDTVFANKCYLHVNLHVPAIFKKYGMEGRP